MSLIRLLACCLGVYESYSHAQIDRFLRLCMSTIIPQPYTSTSLSDSIVTSSITLINDVANAWSKLPAIIADPEHQVVRGEGFVRPLLR